MRDLNQRQSQLFLAITSFLVRYQPSELQRLIDDDVAEMAEAMAATFETASRGVIYEHSPASLPAQRLASAIRPRILEAGGAHGGTAFERDAAVVLRRLKEAARDVGALEPDNRSVFLDLLRRVIRTDTPGGPAGEPADGNDPPRLIVP
jgi:hypothetical protein